MNTNLTDFINNIPEEKGNRKTISLYKLIKTSCPETIKTINKRINGKSLITMLKKSKNWYIIIINYLTVNDILRTEKTDIGTFHNVTEKYMKYFNVPKSTVFSQINFPQHLNLYKDTAEDFLSAVKLKTKDGKEIFETEKKDQYITVSKRLKIGLRYLAYGLLVWSLLQFGILVANYGYKQMLPMLLNSILFSISVVLLIKDKE